MASRPVASRPVGNASGATAETGSSLGAQALLPEPGPSPAVAVCPTQVVGPSPAVVVCPTQVVGPSPAVVGPSPAVVGPSPAVAVPSPAVAVCPTQEPGPSPAVAVPSPAVPGPSPAVAVCPTQEPGPSPAVAVPSPAATTGAVPPLAAASTAVEDPSQVAVGFERTRPPGPDLEGAEVPIPAFRHDKACPGRRRCRSAP